MDDQEIMNKMRKMILEEFTPITKDKDPRKKTDRKKPTYLLPVNKIKKATMTKKLGKCCGYISIHVPRDITFAMGLDKGTVVQISIELLDSRRDGEESIPTMFLNKDNNTLDENEENTENSANNPENQPIL